MAGLAYSSDASAQNCVDNLDALNYPGVTCYELEPLIDDKGVADCTAVGEVTNKLEQEWGVFAADVNSVDGAADGSTCAWIETSRHQFLEVNAVNDNTARWKATLWMQLGDPTITTSGTSNLGMTRVGVDQNSGTNELSQWLFNPGTSFQAVDLLIRFQGAYDAALIGAKAECKAGAGTHARSEINLITTGSPQPGVLGPVAFCSN